MNKVIFMGVEMRESLKEQLEKGYYSSYVVAMLGEIFSNKDRETILYTVLTDVELIEMAEDILADPSYYMSLHKAIDSRMELNTDEDEDEDEDLSDFIEFK